MFNIQLQVPKSTIKITKLRISGSPTVEKRQQKKNINTRYNDKAEIISQI